MVPCNGYNIDMSNFCIIYLLINKVNGKIYVGQTWQSLKERWDSGHGYKKCWHVNNAINKYGVDNFCYQLLTIAGTQETANYWEAYFIGNLKSRDKNIGYNLRGAGSHGKHSEETKRKITEKNTGRVMSEETKQKLRKINTGKTLTEEHKNKIGLKNKGKTFPGRVLSEETKNKLSEGRKGIVFSKDHKKKISEAQIGKKFSDATKLKISLSKRGKKRKSKVR